MTIPQLSQLHHTTIITGNRKANLEEVKKYLEREGVQFLSSADFMLLESDQLTIDEVRQVVHYVSAKAVSKARFVILSFDRTGTNEAQNALLKSLEEPQAGTYFFILVPTIDEILGTILSRAQVISGDQSVGETRLDVDTFLSSTMAARFVLIEEWTKSKKEEDNLTKTEVRNFIEQLESVLWGKVSKGDKMQDTEKLFADIRKMKEYTSIRGASHRVLLDYLAMTVPQVK